MRRRAERSAVPQRTNVASMVGEAVPHNVGGTAELVERKPSGLGRGCGLAWEQAWLPNSKGAGVASK